MSVSARQAWIGLFILFLAVLLVLVAAVNWHHVTGVNFLQILADGADHVIQGC